MRLPPFTVPGILRLSTALAAAWLLGACSPPEDAPETVAPESPNTPIVQVAQAQVSSQGPEVVTSGLLSYDDEIELAFSSSGVVEAVLVDAGDPVRDGQELARLEAIRLASDLESARTERLQAEREALRLDRLFRDSVATLETVEQAKTRLDISAARERVAELNLERAVLRAPRSGRVLRRLIDPGETVQPGQPAIVVGAGESGWIIRAMVTGRDVVRLRTRDSAHVLVDALPEREFPAMVTDIGFAAGKENGMFDVELSVRDDRAVLRPGLAARIHIRPNSEGALYRVPVEAVVSARDGVGWLFAIAREEGDTGTIRRVRVQIEALSGDDVLVASDSLLGDIVVGGGEGLAEGDRVRLRNADSGASG